jgi:hypothetical protein
MVMFKMMMMMSHPLNLKVEEAKVKAKVKAKTEKKEKKEKRNKLNNKNDILV